MQIIVHSIKPCDHPDIPKFTKMEAVVNFYDDQSEYHNSATVEIFIEKRDILLSELKKDAIQAAIDFLKLAISSHS